MDRYFLNDARVTVTDRFIRIDRVAFATKNISSVQRRDRRKSILPLLLSIVCAVIAIEFVVTSAYVGALILSCVTAATGVYYYFSRNLHFVKVTGGGGDHVDFCSSDLDYANTIADQIVCAIRSE